MGDMMGGMMGGDAMGGFMGGSGDPGDEMNAGGNTGDPGGEMNAGGGTPAGEEDSGSGGGGGILNTLQGLVKSAAEKVARLIHPRLPRRRLRPRQGFRFRH